MNKINRMGLSLILLSIIILLFLTVGYLQPETTNFFKDLLVFASVILGIAGFTMLINGEPPAS